MMQNTKDRKGWVAYIRPLSLSASFNCSQLLDFRKEVKEKITVCSQVFSISLASFLQNLSALLLPELSPTLFPLPSVLTPHCLVSLCDLSEWMSAVGRCLQAPWPQSSNEQV